jgi:hypothetical protein
MECSRQYSQRKTAAKDEGERPIPGFLGSVVYWRRINEKNSIISAY